MTTIFISHSSKDNDAAERMKAWLEAEPRKHHVFLDFHPEAGIEGGAKWEETLYDRLRQCQVVLPLLTLNWLSSKWCFAEVVHARAIGKLIVPVKIELCETNGVLGDTQQIDLTTNNRSEGEQRLESRLSEIFNWDNERSPYPGLMAFQEDDAAIFFGRGPEITASIEKLNSLRRQGRGAPRFALLLGASGSGKSSIARAGVLPRLKRNRDSWLPLPPFRPQENPLDELAWSLADAFTANEQARPLNQIRQKLADAADKFPPDGDSLLELVRDLQRATKQRDATVLITIDQAEELFGYSDKVQAGRFLGLLRAALERSDRQLMALATLRSDFLGTFQTHPFLDDRGYSDLFAYQEVTIDPLPEERFREIIRGPTGLIGLDIDEELVDQMVQDTGTRDALPLLAFTLRRMWDDEVIRADNHFQLEEYDRLGGLDGAVRTAAAEALDAPRRTENELRQLHAAFVPTMVRVNAEGKVARRRAYLDEMPACAIPLLTRFVDARLLITGRDQDARETIEVAHEALLRTWPVLTTWLEDDQDKLRLLESLHRNAAEWKESGYQDDLLAHRDGRLADALELARDQRFALGEDEKAYLDACQSTQLARERAKKEEQERRIKDAEQIAAEQKRTARRTKIGAAIAASLAIVSGVAGLIAWNQMTKADRRAEEAERQRQIALGRQLGVRALWMAENGNSSDLIEKAAVFAREAWQRASTPEAYATAERLLRSLPVARFDHGAAVHDVAFAPDGKTLATASIGNVITGAAGDARLIDVKSRQEIARFDHGADVHDVAFAPDGKTFATASGGSYLRSGTAGDARLIDVKTLQEIARIDHGAPVYDVAFAPDGKTLATASGKTDFAALRIIGSGDARLIDATTGQEIARIDHGNRVNAVAFAPDGSILATASGAGTTGDARLIDVKTGQEIARIDHGVPVHDIAFAPDGKTFATASGGSDLRSGTAGDARLIDVKTGQEIARIDHGLHVNVIAFSPNGETLATASSDSTVRLIDAETGKEIAHIDHSGPVQDVAFSSDGTILATATGKSGNLSPDKGDVRLIDAKTGQEIARFDHGDFVSAVAFSPDGNTLASASGSMGLYIGNGGASLMDTKPAHEIARIDHGAPVQDIAFSPDGTILATASADNTTRLINANTGREIARIEHGDRVNAVAFSPDGDTLATASFDNTARLFDVKTGQDIARIDHDAPVQDVAFSPDGNTLVTASSGDSGSAGNIRLVDVKTGQDIARVDHGGPGTTDEFPTNAIAFAPDGEAIAIASSQLHINFETTGDVLLLDAKTGRKIAHIDYSDRVNAVAFAPDGETVTTASGGARIGGFSAGDVRLIDARTGQEVARIEHSVPVEDVAFAPDGTILATAGGGTTGDARLIDAKTGQEIARIDHVAAVQDIAFSSDGESIATASFDNTARLIDATTGQEIARIDHGDRVSAVAVNPDDKTLATVSLNTVRLLHHPDMVVDLLCTRVGKNLTRNEWQTYLGKEPWKATCDNWSNSEDAAASQ